MVTHDLTQVPCEPRSELLGLFECPEYQGAKVIFIEEAQFFKDLYEFSTISVDQQKKHLIVSGIDGDFQRKPFGEILGANPSCRSR